MAWNRAGDGVIRRPGHLAIRSTRSVALRTGLAAGVRSFRSDVMLRRHEQGAIRASLHADSSRRLRNALSPARPGELFTARRIVTEVLCYVRSDRNRLEPKPKH